jgi:hypothetical protein
MKEPAVNWRKGATFWKRSMSWVAAAAVSWAVVHGESYEDGAAGPGRIVSNFVVDRDVFGGGIFYWAIAELETSRIVARGKMDVEGVDRIILAPQTAYRFMSFYAETLSLGVTDFTTPRAGNRFEIPKVRYRVLAEPADADGDGLPDELEWIAGTNPLNPDTDGDGFLDGAEVRQGMNPLDGFFVDTGIIARGPTPGAAVDISVINNIAIVACGSSGVAVFNVRQGTAPVRVAQVAVPGEALAVTSFGNLIGVAAGTGGLVIIDASDPPSAAIRRQVRLSSPAVAITARGNEAFVGLANGTIVMVDMSTGTELSRYSRITARIQDLGERRGYLYALTVGRLHALRINGGDFEQTHAEVIPGTVGAGQIRLRLFMGDNFAYATHMSGYNIIGMNDPGKPSLIRHAQTSQFGWKQIVANGSGLGVAAVSPNSTLDGRHHIDLYEVGKDNLGTRYLSTIETPGIARAVALYNGLAYVADGASGLQVINYLAFDTLGVPPEIELKVDAPQGKVEEGKVFSVEARVQDDVLVRSVEFFINGQPAVLDGNFPFELGLISPLIEGGRTTFEMHAIATDTGGNATRSETITLELIPDATPPRVRSITPGLGSIVGQIGSVLLQFSEPLDENTLRRSSVQLTGAGLDGYFDTADDVLVEARMEYRRDVSTLTLVFPDNEAAPDLYRVRAQSPLADLAGNRMVVPFVSTFRAYGYLDSDQDGLPDDLEIALGLDPFNPDTDGNGIPDGMEDGDRDGLPNIGEVILGLDPLNPDTNGNGIRDGAEDFDFDGISNGDEIRLGTDPRKIDTDGDGVDDYTEIAEKTDPNNPRSAPPRRVASQTVSFLNALPETIPSEFEFALSSAPASYLNAILEPLSNEFQYSVVSSQVSYLNSALEEWNELTRYVLSPLYSFLNEPNPARQASQPDSTTGEPLKNIALTP